MTTNAPTEPILLNGDPLEEIDDFAYLWSILNKDNGAGKKTSQLDSTNKVRAEFTQLEPI